MAEPEPRRPLSRVPPHDLEVERSILGSALLVANAAGVVAQLDAGAFYAPAHQTIAQVIGELHGEGSSTDPGTVAALLRNRGLLDSIGGPRYLVDLQADTPTTSGLAKWIDLLHAYAARRRTLGLAAEIVDAVYRDTDTSGLVAELHDSATRTALAQESSWEPVNLVRALAGEGDELEPAHLARTDGAAILYPGKIHSFVGEPEGGKSWLALLACTQAINDGDHVLYVDFEADDVTQTTRLLELGAQPDHIIERFHYIHPDEPHDKAAALRLAASIDAWHPTIVILDGVAEALALNGWDENKAGDVTAFYVTVARPLARCGAAVATIDHVVKDKDSQGRYARGSTAKLAAIDGAVYKLEVIKPFGRGLAGAAKVLVNKDRHGHVRSIANGGKLLGELHLDSTRGGTIGLELQPPATTQSGGPWRPTRLMEKASRALEEGDEATGNEVASVVGGTKKYVLDALRVLVAEGFVTTRPGHGRAVLHRSEKPYREAFETDYPDDPRTGHDQ